MMTDGTLVCALNKWCLNSLMLRLCHDQQTIRWVVVVGACCFSHFSLISYYCRL